VKPSLLAALACLAAVAAFAEGTGPAPAAEAPVAPAAALGVWTADFDAARALAAETGRPIFLNFTGSDWCHWCKLADRQVFSTEAWKNYASSRLVTVFVDFPDKLPISAEQRKANEALATKYSVAGFPTFLLLAPDGETVLGRFGIDRNESFMSFTAKIEKLLGAPKSIEPPIVLRD